MLPRDTFTFATSTAGTQTIVVTTSPATILGLDIFQENTASLTDIRCNSATSTRIALTNFALSTGYRELNFYCSNGIYLTKTGNDTAFTTINYVARERTTVADPTLSTYDFYAVAVLVVMSGILLLDLLRRLFANR